MNEGVLHSSGPTGPSYNTRIVLVNAPVLAVFEPWYDEPDFGRTALACLAAYLRNNGYSKVKIVDAKLERMDFERCTKEILAFEPDVVGFTAFTNEIKPSSYLAAKLKQKNPDLLTIIGGVHITSIPQKTMEEFDMFDVGVIGEGEETLLDIVKAKANDAPYTGIPGTICKDVDGKLVQGPPRERIMDQDTLPIPAWDLLPAANTYFVQTLRGCPFNCVFCMNPNGRIARKRSVELVIEELEYIIDTYKPEKISFGDELFSVDVSRTHALLDAMIEHGIGEKVKWDVQTHVRYVDDEMFKKFKLANVERVEMGIETGDEMALKKMGKGTNLKMIEQAYKAARRHNVEIGTFFILGQPNETVKSIWATIKLAIKINPQLPMFGLMTPYPGTAVANMAAKGEAGYKLLSTDWDDYNKQIGGALAFQYISRWQLEFMQSVAYVLVYVCNFRFVDLIKLIWNYRVGVYQMLKKLTTGKQSMMIGLQKPDDYDKLTSKISKATKEEMIQSYVDWSKYQKDRMVVNRAEKAELADQ